MTVNKDLAKINAAQAIDKLRQTGLVDTQSLAILDKMATEAIELGADLEEKGGFKTLGAPGVTGETITDGPVVSRITNNGPAKIEKENTKKISGTNLFGKSTGNGQLTIGIAQRSPKALSSLLKDVVKADQATINSVNSETSSVPTRVETAVKKDPIADLNKAVKVATKLQQETLGNPLGSANDPFGSLGAKFGNIMASITSTTQSGGSFKELGKALPDIESEVSDPVTGEKSFSQNIVEPSGFTNLSKALSKGGSFGDLASTIESLDIKLLAKGFAGRHTNITKYKFEPVTSQEEFELEISNSTRELQNMIIGWLGNAADVTFTVKQIHREMSQARTVPMDIEAIHAGVQEHYIIYPDGQVIRGRPLSFEMGSFNPEVIRVGAVNIKLVAGSTESIANPKWKEFYSQDSITPDQWKSIDILIESFFRVKPGGEVLTIQDIDPQKTEPGFSGVQYVKKFNKESIYQNKASTAKLPQKRATGFLEVKTTNAEVVEEPAPNNVQGAPDPSKIKDLADLKEEVTPEEPPSPEEVQKEIEEAQKKISDMTSEIDNKMAEAAKTGTGLLGDLEANINSSGSFLDGAIKTAQQQRQRMIDAGYKYNPVTNSWDK